MGKTRGLAEEAKQAQLVDYRMKSLPFENRLSTYCRSASQKANKDLPFGFFQSSRRNAGEFYSALRSRISTSSVQPANISRSASNQHYACRCHQRLMFLQMP